MNDQMYLTRMESALASLIQSPYSGTNQELNKLLFNTFVDGFELG